MKRFIILPFLIFVLFGVRSSAQKSTAYLALGSNITDDYLTESGISQVGTRLGLNVGPGVSVQIHRRWEMNLELLYSQNGYYANPTQFPPVALDKVTLHFLEVPLTVGYRFNIRNKQEKSFYKNRIAGGIAYSHLLKDKITAKDGTTLTDEIRFRRENTLLFNLAGMHYINESIALNGRATLSTFGKWTFAVRVLFYI